GRIHLEARRDQRPRHVRNQRRRAHRAGKTRTHRTGLRREKRSDSRRPPAQQATGSLRLVPGEPPAADGEVGKDQDQRTGDEEPDERSGWWRRGLLGDELWAL